MMSKTFYSFAVLFTVMVSYAVAKAVSSKDERNELGCNAFSGWRTCLGKRMTELRADDELESAADKLESEGRTEFARSAKSLFNNDVRNYDRLNSRRGGTDEKQTKNRLFKAFMKFFKEKFGNEKDN